MHIITNRDIQHIAQTIQEIINTILLGSRAARSRRHRCRYIGIGIGISISGWSIPVIGIFTGIVVPEGTCLCRSTTSTARSLLRDRVEIVKVLVDVLADVGLGGLRGEAEEVIFIVILGSNHLRTGTGEVVFVIFLLSKLLLTTRTAATTFRRTNGKRIL